MLGKYPGQTAEICLPIFTEMNLEYFWHVLIFNTVFVFEVHWCDSLSIFEETVIINSRFTFFRDVNTLLYFM